MLNKTEKNYNHYQVRIDHYKYSIVLLNREIIFNQKEYYVLNVNTR